MIRKILIANRGEIAVRIIRTCREMGIRTVVVYSEPDAQSLAVEMADEAVAIGGHSPTESYLSIPKILEAARRTGADAVHPGFGFLAENAAFGYAVLAANLIWIGPSPSSIEAMADKRFAKTMLQGVPFVPGYIEADQSNEAFIQAAAAIGYPIMVKAAAGGGGKGMRLVHRAEDLADALDSARREAAQAFSNDSLMLERALLNPRHIEVQVFGDQMGNVIAIGERECSIQRRHQKIVEETPSTALDPDLRQRIQITAVSIARQIGYYSAGTLEFLLDEDGSFYFMEMNTRLQVEHPVTEMVYGIDLVRWQILVAEGASLTDLTAGLTLEPNGHAIEVRVYAEDPSNDFLPVTGQIAYFAPAQHVRTDTGIRTGDVISPYYDPMIAKVIAHAPTRSAAIRRLEYALGEMSLLGLTNNIAYLRRVLLSPAHLAGRISTRFVQEHANLLPDERDVPFVALAAAALARGGANAWRNFPNRPVRHTFAQGETRILVLLEKSGDGFNVTAGDQTSFIRLLKSMPPHFVLELDGLRQNVLVISSGDRTWVQTIDRTLSLSWVDPMPATSSEDSAAGSLRAPMPGKIIQVLVSDGDTVQTGDTLMILEAMKMEHRISAPYSGQVERINYATGDAVQADEILLALVPLDKPPS
jgi:acetyl/propionyl-CoA carboxylase alpha subunit